MDLLQINQPDFDQDIYLSGDMLMAMLPCLAVKKMAI